MPGAVTVHVRLRPMAADGREGLRPAVLASDVGSEVLVCADRKTTDAARRRSKSPSAAGSSMIRRGGSITPSRTIPLRTGVNFTMQYGRIPTGAASRAEGATSPPRRVNGSTSVASRRPGSSPSPPRGLLDSPPRRSLLFGTTSPPRAVEHDDPAHYRGAQRFAFDAVYGPQSDQVDVFEGTMRTALEASLDDGTSGVAICYGPTGSGKSHTVLGPPAVRYNFRAFLDADVGSDVRNAAAAERLDDGGVANAGLLPRAIDWLLGIKKTQARTLRGTATLTDIAIAAIEVYGDDVRDLLAPGCPSVKTLRDQASTVAGVLGDAVGFVPIDSICDAWSLLDLASQRRAVGSHTQNADSSRSHLLFVLHLGQRPLHKNNNNNNQSPREPLWVPFVVVDLAGSERVKATGVSGQGLAEAQHINKSLSALNSVIVALHTRAAFIPYRDSKLTRLLRPCIDPHTGSGNGSVVVIVHVPPAEEQRGEALVTIAMAQRLKNIQQPTPVEGAANLAEYHHDAIDVKIASYAAALTRASEERNLLLAELTIAEASTGAPMRRVARARAAAPLVNSGGSDRIQRSDHTALDAVRERETALRARERYVASAIEHATREVEAEERAMQCDAVDQRDATDAVLRAALQLKRQTADVQHLLQRTRSEGLAECDAALARLDKALLLLGTGDGSPLSAQTLRLLDRQRCEIQSVRRHHTDVKSVWTERTRPAMMNCIELNDCRVDLRLLAIEVACLDAMRESLIRSVAHQVVVASQLTDVVEDDVVAVGGDWDLVVPRPLAAEYLWEREQETHSLTVAQWQVHACTVLSEGLTMPRAGTPTLTARRLHERAAGIEALLFCGHDSSNGRCLSLPTGGVAAVRDAVVAWVAASFRPTPTASASSSAWAVRELRRLPGTRTLVSRSVGDAAAARWHSTAQHVSCDIDTPVDDRVELRADEWMRGTGLVFAAAGVHVATPIVAVGAAPGATNLVTIVAGTLLEQRPLEEIGGDESSTAQCDAALPSRFDIAFAAIVEPRFADVLVGALSCGLDAARCAPPSSAPRRQVAVSDPPPAPASPKRKSSSAADFDSGGDAVSAVTPVRRSVVPWSRPTPVARRGAAAAAQVDYVAMLLEAVQADDATRAPGAAGVCLVSLSNRADGTVDAVVHRVFLAAELLRSRGLAPASPSRGPRGEDVVDPAMIMRMTPTEAFYMSRASLLVDLCTFIGIVAREEVAARLLTSGVAILWRRDQPEYDMVEI